MKAILPRRLPIIATLVGLLTAATAADGDPPTPSLAPGTPFPNIALPRVGAMEDVVPIVDRFRGHRTVVHIFASW